MIKVGISQSNYLPWRGYFSLINSVDHFIFLDNVKFTKRDWRNRNQIKTPNGLMWLTVPLVLRNNANARIEEIEIIGNEFIAKHLEAIRRNYSKSTNFNSYWPWFQELLMRNYSNNLSNFNRAIIKQISIKFGTETIFHDAQDFSTSTDASQRLVDICKALNADTYVTGTKAMGYLNQNLFKNSDIQVEWANYSFPEYSQLWDSKFISNVSILDVIFNAGFDKTLITPCV